MRIHCISCGKSVSTEVPESTVIRATSTCPECIEKEPDYESKYNSVVEVLKKWKKNCYDTMEGSYCHPEENILAAIALSGGEGDGK